MRGLGYSRKPGDYPRDTRAIGPGHGQHIPAVQRHTGDAPKKETAAGKSQICPVPQRIRGDAPRRWGSWRARRSANGTTRRPLLEESWLCVRKCAGRLCVVWDSQGPKGTGSGMIKRQVRDLSSTVRQTGGTLATRQSERRRQGTARFVWYHSGPVATLRGDRGCGGHIGQR